MEDTLGNWMRNWDNATICDRHLVTAKGKEDDDDDDDGGSNDPEG